jgi:hypothetical protein
MKQYVIDQLRESDFLQIQEFLDSHAERTAIDGIYWVKLPENLGTSVQQAHTACQPHYFAVSLSLQDVAFELLIRSRPMMRCNCIAYATPKQREYLLNFADSMLEQLGIKL